jgi:hypothetical protein
VAPKEINHLLKTKPPQLLSGATFGATICKFRYGTW